MSLKPDDLAQIILDSIDDDEPPTALYTLNIHEARMLAHAVLNVVQADARVGRVSDEAEIAASEAYAQGVGERPFSQRMRAAITAGWVLDETTHVQALLEQARQPEADRAAIRATAADLVRRVRARAGDASLVESFMRQYDLGSEEGVLMMCVAEALLRIPDQDTADALIRDKLGEATNLIDENDSRLTQLSEGARTLANVLDQIRDEIVAAAPPLRTILTSLVEVEQEFGGTETLRSVEASAKMIDLLRGVGDLTADETAARGVPAEWLDELVAAAWAAERSARAETGVLDGVALGLPALLRAVKLQKRAARVGFDWASAEDVLAKLAEESRELVEARDELGQREVEEEFGDLLFVMANLARHLKVDPEAALRAANAKFTRRFAAIEAGLARNGRRPEDATLEEMESLWNEAKRLEKL